MPDTPHTSLTGALDTATLKQGSLVNSVLKLFKDGFTPDPTTPVADFDSNECDFDDYAPITIAAWSAPTLASVPGYNINGGLQTFACAADQVTPNTVGGGWLEDAAGNLLDYFTFSPGKPMALAGQAVTWIPAEFFGAS